MGNQGGGFFGRLKRSLAPKIEPAPQSDPSGARDVTAGHANVASGIVTAGRSATSPVSIGGGVPSQAADPGLQAGAATAVAGHASSATAPQAAAQHSENGNAAAWFVDRHIAQGRGTKAAFREADGDRRMMTYGELAEASGRMAGALARADIRREERAAMFVLDRNEFPIIFWGCLKAGVQPIAINTLLATDVYRAILRDSRASIAFVSAELMPVVGPALSEATDVRQVVVVGGAATGGATTYDAFVARAPERPTLVCAPDEIAFWLYSSGSTGAPKGVRHVHEALQVTCDTFGRNVLGIREDDVVFSAAKLFFAYGLGNGMSFPMSVGATAVLFSGRPTPDSVSDILDREKPTIYYGVPTLFAAMLHAWDAGAARPEAPLRLCTSAGRPCRRRWGDGGTRSGASISSTGSARRRCSIFFSLTGRMTCSTELRACRCRAMMCGWWTKTTPMSDRGGSANCWFAGGRPQPTIGISAPRAVPPSRGSGPAPVTSMN